ncbi:phosphatase PAP2 family protein [Streptomyces sp. DH37]|uniref:phosphatase PAP2 family protein n=1 Tax=Streptomyces sp. DH37 TaxID=3040122 RepID=UPI002441DB54|nr:phosphatase PAP2 family protein [Streptomyces sp. DH37]MDG9702141.1 phosphatase PAP2 family protein [Streptomyces sp. DH37]
MARTRLRWWTELPLIAVVYGVYSAGRLLARGDVSTAVDHGLAILRLEERLSLDPERFLNRLFTGHAWLGVPADFAYATLHYVVTPAVLVWVFRRHSAHYRRLRTWLMVSTLIGLAGFTLVPTCPPRLLAAAHGFTDTMAQYGEYGWWGGEASAPRGLGGLTNQYAAMPSLHVGWALWCGVVLWRLGGRGPWARAAAVGYPLLTTVVVMGTANHYLLDAVAGAAVMGAGLLLTRPALRCADRAAAWARRYGPDGRAEDARPGGPLPGRRAAAPAREELNSTIVTAGCHTSPGEQQPRQPTDDSPAPAAR